MLVSMLMIAAAVVRVSVRAVAIVVVSSWPTDLVTSRPGALVGVYFVASGLVKRH